MPSDQMRRHPSYRPVSRPPLQAGGRPCGDGGHHAPMSRGSAALRRSRRPQGAELAETTGAGTGLAARVAVASVVALGHVAVGGAPERRAAREHTTEVRWGRIDMVAAAMVVAPWIVGRTAGRAGEPTTQAFP